MTTQWEPSALEAFAVMAWGPLGPAEQQRGLEGGRVFLRSARTGPICGPLSNEEQALPMGVLFHFKQLIFYMWEPDAQGQAPIGGCDIPLSTH